MEGTEVTTEPTDELMTSEFEFVEHPIKCDPEELTCLQSDSTQSSNHQANLQKCDQCDMEYEPKLFTWHTKYCHGSDAVVNITKFGNKQHSYQCVLCKSVFKKLQTAMDHIHLNHQLANFTHHCKYCNTSIYLWKSLYRHEKICSVKKTKLLKSLKCVQCDIKYAYPEMLSWHFENCHGENPNVIIERIDGNKLSFQCVYCQDSFKEIYAIIAHLHNKLQLSNLPFRCNNCNKQFVRRGSMVIHKIGCKKKAGNSQAQSFLQIDRADEFLTSELDIEGHQIKLEPEEIQLNTQNAASTSSTTMKEDRIIKDLKCVLCGIKYTNPEIVGWHSKYCHGTDAVVKIVSNNNRKASYVCTFCNAVHTRLVNMTRHLHCQHHFNDLPYKCNGCGVNYIKRQNWKCHRLKCPFNQPGVGDQASETTSWKEFPNPVKLEPDDTIPVHQRDGLRLQDTNKKYVSKNFKCYECVVNYAFPENLAWHKDHCHGPNAIVKVAKLPYNNVTHQCVFCNCLFKKLEDIIRHLQRKHQFINLPFHCDNCDLKFVGRKYLLRHKRTCKKRQEAQRFDQQSFEEIPKIDVEDSSVKVEPGNDQLKLFKQQMNDMDPALTCCRVLLPKLLECELCRFYTVSKIELTTHIQAHLKPNTIAGTQLKIHPVNEGEETKNHKCQQCGVKFDLAEKFVWHNEFCHGSDAIVTVIKINDKLDYIYQCDICSSDFKNIDLVILHLKGKHRLKKLPFRCKLCDKMFALNSKLKNHQVACWNKKDYKFTRPHFKPTKSSVKCKMCDEPFESEVEMKTHISNFHAFRNNEMRYKCMHCDVTFHFLPHLKSHCHKKHPGKPIFQCDVCKAEFQSYGAHYRHTKYKHSKSVFACKICASTFTYPSGLYTHLQHVHSQKTFSCMFCSATFKCHFYMRKHMKLQHLKQIFRCEHCTYATQKKPDLCMHIQNYHLKLYRWNDI